MNVMPMMAVERSHMRNDFVWPLVRAEYASTMLMLLMSSTKVLTEVTGMLKTSSGKGPRWLLPW